MYLQLVIKIVEEKWVVKNTQLCSFSIFEVKSNSVFT